MNKIFNKIKEKLVTGNESGQIKLSKYNYFITEFKDNNKFIGNVKKSFNFNINTNNTNNLGARK